jgi:hypothetical protein
MGAMSPRKPKRGRPPLKAGQAKSVLIQVRVTPEEARAIEEQAQTDQKPRSEWIRRRLIPGEKDPKPEATEQKPEEKPGA